MFLFLNKTQSIFNFAKTYERPRLFLLHCCEIHVFNSNFYLRKSVKDSRKL